MEINLVRVDDRLLHGQVMCAWVPFVEADTLIVASDDAAGDYLAREIMSSCSMPGLDVRVRKVEEAAREITSEEGGGARAILIVGEIRDAKRLFDEGVRFTSLNLGNVHHEARGRSITPSVALDERDEEILERLLGAGVSVEIRNVPGSAPVAYLPRKRQGA